MNQQLILALSAALAAPYGTAVHQTVAALCILRGEDPNELMHVPDFDSGDPVCRWHLVLAEELLRAALRKELAV